MSRGSKDQRDQLALEFGVYTGWMSDAISDLDLDDPLPVACRGTGNPSLFRYLVQGFDPAPGQRILDLGCGMGGPGEWLRRTLDVQVVGIDFMEEEVRAARALFPEVAVCTGSISSLPFPSASFHGVWVVGVLEMVFDKAAVANEIRRVLSPGSAAVVFVHVRAAEEMEDPPLSDEFVWPAALEDIFEANSFEIVEAAATPTLHPVPAGWGDAIRRVKGHVADRHSADPRHEAVEAERDRFGRLLRAGSIEPWRFVLRRPT